MDNFQPVDPIYMTCVRVVFALLLQYQVINEMQDAMKLLIFFKRLKGNKNNLKG